MGSRASTTLRLPVRVHSHWQQASGSGSAPSMGGGRSSAQLPNLGRSGEVRFQKEKKLECPAAAADSSEESRAARVRILLRRGTPIEAA